MVDARFIEGGTNIHYLEHKLASKPDLPKETGIGAKSETKVADVKADL
jgi:acetyl-CoA carboxylase biotin carboxylase subunit